MMGICFDCLVTIDGIANRQSCQVDVAEGMVVQSQHGPRVIDGRIPE
jgi:predicted molibdopterin-dependent oxidoreductase YjgC